MTEGKLAFQSLVFLCDRDIQSEVSARSLVTNFMTRQRQPLVHRKTARAEGWSEAGLLLAIIAFFFLLPWYSFDSVWEVDELFWSVWFGFSGFAFLWYIFRAVKHFRSVGFFELRLDDSLLTCHFPIPEFGKCFSVALEDLVRLEEFYDGEYISWSVWDHAGTEYRLPFEYGTPTKVFAEAICEQLLLRPQESNERGLTVWTRRSRARHQSNKQHGGIGAGGTTE